MLTSERILPVAVPGAPPPLVTDLAQARASFAWEDARALLEGLPGGRGLNIAHEAVDRHADGPLASATAIRWLGRDGGRAEISYAALADDTARFASALDALDLPQGTRVASLLGRVPELYVAALGTLKHGSVFSPLFASFGADPVAQRLALGAVAVLVTTPELYARRVASRRASLPHLKHVLLVQAPGAQAVQPSPGVWDFRRLLDTASSLWQIPATREDSPALLHFTSGTTGPPKAAVHVHEAVVAHRHTAALALDLRAGDIFWCTADPGWVTGTSYGIVAPLVLGATLVSDEAEFDAARWYATLEREQVNVWYTSPTALRMLRRAGDALARSHDLRHLRFAASVGEPLDPELVLWSAATLGQPVHDNWWQTETGGIMIANLRGQELRPGSMGRPLPGIDAAILRRDADGEILLDDDEAAVVAEVGESGELALRPGWPSMFRSYLGEEERYRRCFRAGWYLTGDVARRDEDGWFWFVGRSDDVIKSAGHLIGPFEVEAVLQQHPAVADVAVIGVPDPLAGHLVRAIVVPDAGQGATAGPQLARELIGFARQRLGAAVAPRSIGFADALPRNRAGKVVRRLLVASELGIQAADGATEDGRDHHR